MDWLKVEHTYLKRDKLGDEAEECSWDGQSGGNGDILWKII